MKTNRKICHKETSSSKISASQEKYIKNVVGEHLQFAHMKKAAIWNETVKEEEDMIKSAMKHINSGVNLTNDEFWLLELALMDHADRVVEDQSPAIKSKANESNYSARVVNALHDRYTPADESVPMLILNPHLS